MKQPKPSPPAGIPDGTLQLGGPIDWFTASLQVIGDDLDPDQVTNLLGLKPSRSQRRGVPVLRPDGSERYTPQFGRWTRDLKPTQTDEWDIVEVIQLLFKDLPEDLATWNELARTCRVRVAFGLNVPDSNREFELEPEVLRFLLARNASIWFDIYCEQEE